MPEQFGDKTQAATDHRREKAREEGFIARSQDLAAAVLLVVGLCGLLYFGPMAVDYFVQFAERCLGGVVWRRLDRVDAALEFQEILYRVAYFLFPLLVLIFAAAVLVNWLQVGIVFLPAKLGFNPQHLNPLEGWKRMFSITSVVRLGFALSKVVLVGGVAFWAVAPEQTRIAELGLLEIRPLASTLVEIALWCSLKIAAALVLLAIFDYFFQWWKNEQDLRMTTQEVREEMKELQGDPQTVSRRRQVQRELVMHRAKDSVPQADVVVTNPTELAIALRYEPETMAAPVVVAKGAGVLAQRIRRLALEHSVPIVERKELARFLYKNVRVNQPIPIEQYAAVAEVLKYVYELKGKTLPRNQAA